jgi:hypothetical protein
VPSPFAALDAQTREIMQAELLRIWERGQKTVLFVTHQIDEAVFLSDRVLVFARRPGRLQEEVKIALPQRRTLEIKRTAEFVALVDHIWRLIEDDVRAAALYKNPRPGSGPPGPNSGRNDVNYCRVLGSFATLLMSFQGSKSRAFSGPTLPRQTRHRASRQGELTRNAAFGGKHEF